MTARPNLRSAASVGLRLAPLLATALLNRPELWGDLVKWGLADHVVVSRRPGKLRGGAPSTNACRARGGHNMHLVLRWTG